MTGTAFSTGYYDAYRFSVPPEYEFGVYPRQGWGWTVSERKFRGVSTGRLLGRARYSKIRVTLDVSRTAQTRPASEWEAIAASARIPGMAKRPISVYLAEVASDEVLRAIAAGAL